jgi:hypothetical protein
MSTIADSDDIRHEITLLADRIGTVESRLQNEVALPATLETATLMVQVRRITQDLFPGMCEFTNEFDPENPDDRYVVVNVEATGDPKEIVDRSCAWHLRIRKLSTDLSDMLRLSIVPR